MPTTVIGEVSATTSCICTNTQYQWVIDNFWICCKDIGDELVSPRFLSSQASNLTFCHFMFFPKGTKEIFKDYMSLFVNIALWNDNADITEVKLSISNNEGVLETRTFREPATYSKKIWGTVKFVDRNVIKKKANNLCRDDKLTIDVEVNTRKKEKQITVLNLKQLLPTELLLNDYEQLVDNEEFSDVELTIGDKTLRAHKNILSKRSPVFAAMFKSEMREKQENKVEITDARYEVYLEMLRYIYAERVNGIENIADELLAAADKYCLDGLKIMCEESLSKNVNVDNVIEKLRIAYLYGAETLKATTIGFIAAHGSDITNRPEFRQLSSDIVCDVLSAVFNRLM